MSFGISNESPALIDIGKRGVERYGFNLNPTFSGSVPGDLGGYQPLGVARVQAIHSGPMYHTSGDVADTISVPGLERAARFFSFFVTEVSKTSREQINPQAELNGSWTNDRELGPARVALASEIFAAVTPEPRHGDVAQQANPRQQPGASVTIFAPEQHDLYDGRFILSAGRVHMVGSLNDPPGWDHLDNAAKTVKPVSGAWRSISTRSRTRESSRRA